MTAKPAEIITGVVGSFLAFLVAFGVNLSDDQIAATLGLVAWIPLCITLIVNAVRRGKGNPNG